jgi:hypothetical protein
VFPLSRYSLIPELCFLLSMSLSLLLSLSLSLSLLLSLSLSLLLSLSLSLLLSLSPEQSTLIILAWPGLSCEQAHSWP